MGTIGYLYKNIIMKKKKLTLNEELSQMKTIMGKLMNEEYTQMELPFEKESDAPKPWDIEKYYGSHGGSSGWMGSSGKSYGNMDWEGVDFDEKEYDSLDDLHSDYPELIDDKRTHGRHKWYGSGEKLFPSWQKMGKLKVRTRRNID